MRLLPFLLFISFVASPIAFAKDDPFQQNANFVRKLANDGISLSAESAENNSDNDTQLKSFPLEHAKAELLMAQLEPILPENTTISADPRTNRLLVNGSENTIKKLEKLLPALDKELPQVLIETRIVTMNDQSLEEMGVRWGVFDPTPTSHGFNGSLQANFPNSNTNALNVNLAPTQAAASMALQLATINGRLLDLELSALEKENAVEIIASPRLLTTNKQAASIKQGTELPYVLSKGKDETPELQFKEAVLGLEVTPQITDKNKILLDLKVTQNSPGERSQYQESEILAIDKQEITTQVLARNGETIVLGGVFHHTIAKFIEKVPLLGDLPAIGYFFRKKGEHYQKRELIIFVTPHIIFPNDPNQLNAHAQKRYQQSLLRIESIRNVPLPLSP